MYLTDECGELKAPDRTTSLLRAAFGYRKVSTAGFAASPEA